MTPAENKQTVEAALDVLRATLGFYRNRRFDRLAVMPGLMRGERPEAALLNLEAALHDLVAQADRVAELEQELASGERVGTSAWSEKVLREREEAVIRVAELEAALRGPIREALLEAGREIHGHSDHPERISFEAVMVEINKAVDAARAVLAGDGGGA